MSEWPEGTVLRGLTVTEKRHHAAVQVVVCENPYVISGDGRYGGLWRHRHCDYGVLEMLKLEVYGPGPEEFADYWDDDWSAGWHFPPTKN